MPAEWQIRTAKAHFSELIDQAQTGGPQFITRHGTRRTVVLSIADYQALVERAPDFKSYLLGAPKVDDFAISRSKDTGGEVEEQA